VLDHVGFRDVQWGREVDVFSGSEHESDAKEFETRGVTFAAHKPRDIAANRRRERTNRP
jgi:hypothetical protein